MRQLTKWPEQGGRWGWLGWPQQGSAWRRRWLGGWSTPRSLLVRRWSASNWSMVGTGGRTVQDQSDRPGILWQHNSSTHLKGRITKEDPMDSVLFQIQWTFVINWFWQKENLFFFLVEFNRTWLLVKWIPEHVKVAHELDDHLPLVRDGYISSIVIGFRWVNGTFEL